MSSSSPAPSNLPVLLSRTGRSRLLARDIIEGILWTLLPDFRLVTQEGSEEKKRVRATRAQRIELLQSILVMSPDAADVPHMATVNWHADVPEWATEYLVPETKAGVYQFDDAGNAKLAVEHRRSYTLRGSTKLPGKDQKTLVDTEVLPLIVADGNGGLVPYVSARQQGGEVVYIGVDGMLCIFVADIDPLTWEPKLNKSGRPYYKAIPVALARQETVRMWNDLVERRAAQDTTYPKEAELVKPFAHNLYGRKVLKFTPQGHPAYRGGLLGILKPKKYREDKDGIDPSKDARWVVGQLVGKTVKPGKGIRLIAPPDGKRFEAHKLEIEEQWTGIEVKNVDGLWGAGTRITSHVVAAEQETIDALAALGLTLYSTSPMGVKPRADELLKAAVGDQNPMVVALRTRGDIEVDMPESTVRQAMRAMSDILVKRGRETYREARDRFVHELGLDGSQAHGLSLADTLGSTKEHPVEPTPELIRQAHDRVDEDLLAAAIVGSQTAKDLGLVVWAGDCWVLVESRKALLLALASVAGIEMAPPPEPPKAETPADPPGDGNGTPPAEGEPPPATT